MRRLENWRQEKKAREMWVASRVATALNSQTGSDYHAVPGEDPPDAVLLSRRQGLKKIEVEIVSLPVEDFTARNDNLNVRRFRNALEDGLTTRGYQISVHLLDTAKRHGVPEEIVKKLISIVAGLVEKVALHEGTRVDFCEAYARYPDIAEYVSCINVACFPSSRSIAVTTPLATWPPRDDSWIVGQSRRNDRKLVMAWWLRSMVHG